MGSGWRIHSLLCRKTRTWSAGHPRSGARRARSRDPRRARLQLLIWQAWRGRVSLLSSPDPASPRSSCERRLYGPERNAPAPFSCWTDRLLAAFNRRLLEACRMKYVIAIIKPHVLDEVREALGAIGVAGLTVSEVKGFGRQKGQPEIYRGAEYQTNMIPKVKMEIAVSDALASRVVETIQFTAGTDSI